MQYSEAIDWLFNQFPSYQNIGKSAYKPDLSNIKQLCDCLEINLSHLKYIHIAGTNGKGSTSNMLASILMEAEYNVGIFTSPHLIDFRERIAINKELITEAAVIAFCQRIQHAQLTFHPSFFEITFAMALHFFSESSCDICIIETGLGGRLDATNIITPILSIITNISLDHTDLLGDTFSQIAFEKAGIIKPTIPVIIGEYHPETLPVFQEKAKQLDAELILAFDFDNTTDEGNYKALNERTVKCAISKINSLGFSISNQNILDGIAHVHVNRNFQARFQQIEETPLTFIDVSHNEAGLKKTFELLKHVQKGKLHIIYGASSDKDLEVILPHFPQDASYYFTTFSSNRSCTKQKLREKSANSTLSIHFFDSLKETLEHTKQLVNKEDTLLITGSFFLVSDFLQLFSKNHL